tara:strand:+ start:49 stop:642 length:594 start_codon:yes stop_codon:yes gene_type:complete
MNFPTKAITIIGLAGLFLSFNARSESAARAIDHRKSKVGFIAHTTMFDVEGIFEKWEADIKLDPNDLTQSSFVLQVQTASVNTEIDKRDEHLRTDDFFASQKYPTARFQSTAVKVTSPGTLEIAGKLTIRNKTKPLKILAKYKWKEKENGRTLRIRGQVAVIRQNFDINYVSGMLLPAVNKEVDIVFDVTVKPLTSN